MDSEAERKQAQQDEAKRASRAARRARRHDHSRAEILAAARRVLLSSGVAAMTLDAVATEAGMSKTGLYYYFRSKEALVFELVYGVLERQSRAVHDVVARAADGGEALGAVVGATVEAFAPQLDDFRLAFLFGQVAGAGALRWDAEQFDRIRPLNDLVLAGAAARLGDEQQARPSRAAVEPRLMAFLAYLSAIGLLTMKGLVEPLDDPLRYSDAELVEGFRRVFAAAAAPGREA
ncbi:TetR/AcrR family transcriptional regulator [Kaistia adipata]|uniref:TetR/AcrR family transcriptional regulator n=1 Tax=Kaistia adipata TaxID=166954 RepID=UPI000420E592|nr:TetR/AcrR family transcriptional regulator [Kaistia adipata]